ncbi:MAG TPA: hypothetical protein ENK18_01730 [Deltaproteobacteria bacterium]|nr:hypothetical protein [Deltaproteobacteria bacterium]
MQRSLISAGAGLLLALSHGCTGQTELDPQIASAFEAAKRRATAEPTPPGEGWQPDAILTLSPGLVDQLVSQGLRQRGTLKGILDLGGGITLSPELKIETVELAAARACETCVRTSVHLAGPVRYVAGILGRGSVPLEVDAVVIVEITTPRDASGWVLAARPRAVRKVELDLKNLPKAVTKLAEDQVRSWAEASLVDAEPTPITTLSSDQLPLLELRLASVGAGIQVDLLTQAIEPGTLSGPRARPAMIAEDWQLEIASTSLLSLARRQAFLAGAQSSLQLVPEPTALSLEDDTFTLGVRLWRLSPPGWWRDVQVIGELSIEQGVAQMAATSAEVVGASEGAAWADPLAALTQAALISTVADTLKHSMPASRSATVGGSRIEIGVHAVDGVQRGAALRLGGSFVLTPSGSDDRLDPAGG